MTEEKPKFKKINIFGDLVITGSKGKGRNPKVIYSSPKEKKHFTMMTTPNNVIDFHVTDEKTGKHTPMISKPLNEFQEDLKRLLLEPLIEINPTNPTYDNYLVWVVDDDKKAIFENMIMEYEGKEAKIREKDFQDLVPEDFFNIFYMKDLVKINYKKGIVIDSKTKDVIGTINFLNGKHFFMSYKNIESAIKEMGFNEI